MAPWEAFGKSKWLIQPDEKVVPRGHCQGVRNSSTSCPQLMVKLFAACCDVFTNRRSNCSQLISQSLTGRRAKGQRWHRPREWTPPRFRSPPEGSGQQSSCSQLIPKSLTARRAKGHRWHRPRKWTPPRLRSPPESSGQKGVQR